MEFRVEYLGCCVGPLILGGLLVVLVLTWRRGTKSNDVMAAWRRFGPALGFVRFEGRSMQGEYRGFRAGASIHSRNNYGPHAPYAGFWLEVPGAAGLTVQRAGFSDPSLAAPRAQTGDPDFDRNWVVYGDPRALERLTGRARKELSSVAGHGVTMRQGRLWCAPGHDGQTDVELRSVYERLAAVAAAFSSAQEGLRG